MIFENGLHFEIVSLFFNHIEETRKLGSDVKFDWNSDIKAIDDYV